MNLHAERSHNREGNRARGTVSSHAATLTTERAIDKRTSASIPASRSACTVSACIAHPGE